MSVRSSSHMMEIIWIPDWLGAWADRNPDSRTAVPFFLLSLICPVAIKKGSKARQKAAEGIDTLRLMLGYVSIAVLLWATEGAQYFIQTRDLNIADILWGMIGLFAGGVVGISILSQVPRVLGLVPGMRRQVEALNEAACGQDSRAQAEIRA
jgi:hypothetical protein